MPDPRMRRRIIVPQGGGVPVPDLREPRIAPGEMRQCSIGDTPCGHCGKKGGDEGGERLYRFPASARGAERPTP